MKTLLRFDDLVARGILSNRVTLARWIEKQGFPAGFKLGPNSRAWTQESVDKWLSDRAKAPAEAAE